MFCCLYIPHCVYPSVVDTWGAATLWPLWIMLLRTWVCKYLFETWFLILLDLYPEVGMLGHVVILCLTFFKELQRHFPQQLYNILYFYQQPTRVPVSPYPQQCLFLFFFNSSHSGMKYNEWMVIYFWISKSQPLPLCGFPFDVYYTCLFLF